MSERRKFYKELGRNIARHRERLGISQEELAHRTNLSRNTISKIEVGHGQSYSMNLVKIARGLGVSVDALLTPPSPAELEPASVAWARAIALVPPSERPRAAAMVVAVYGDEPDPEHVANLARPRKEGRKRK